MTIERGKEKAWGKREERGTSWTEVNKKGGQRGENGGAGENIAREKQEK
jgi:hypothetical protein